MKTTLLAIVLTIGTASALPAAASTVSAITHTRPWTHSNITSNIIPKQAVTPAALESTPEQQLTPLTRRSPDLEAITDITGPIIGQVADLLEEVTTALESIPGQLTPMTRRSPDGVLEGISDLSAITDITAPLIGQVADLLEEVTTALESIPGQLIPK